MDGPTIAATNCFLEGSAESDSIFISVALRQVLPCPQEAYIRGSAL
jgi:hypothetical protein